MSWGAPSEPHPSAGTPPIETARATFESEATAAGYLFVELPAPRSVVRGRLGLFIEGAVERALEARGAPPPATAAKGGRGATLIDQVERARVSGAPGLAVWVSSLGSLASPAGVLDPEDSDVVRFWVEAAGTHPVLLGFEPENHRLSVHVEPVTLGSILTAVASEFEAGPESGERDGANETVAEARAPDSELDPHSRLAESARAMADELADDGDTNWLREALIELSTPPPPLARLELAAADGSFDDRARLPAPPHAASSTQTDAPREVAPIDLQFADDDPVAPEPPRLRLDAEQLRKLEGCARELQTASGPKPLTVVERLFQSAYVPLRSAIDRGLDVPSLVEVADEWAQSFERSYTEGFEALRMRTKRPAMVVDVPDIALRVARLHGARSTQLLLVDGLRFDLGNAVNERLSALVGKRAACADRFLLWSALPTTTGRQVELIGRGPSALREMCDGVSEDLVVARGRKASMIRRLKAGNREVLKLDVVAAHLDEPGFEAASEAVTEEVAARVAAHFEGLQPRTLVMVFGDHGFAVERRDGRPATREGGASPEEVLVPAFAWLVGAVH